MNAIPCRQFNGISTPDTDKRLGVYVDPLSVELCLDCPLPVEECRGAPSSHIGHARPCRCPYEKAIAERRLHVVRLPGPGPDGVMKTWECEVER